MTEQEPVVYNGRYEIQRRIARGGMADVFLARDLLLTRPVAVKVLFPEFAGDKSFVERFRREAQAAANLNHPNIVGVYDWGEEGGTYYIVMEYVDGRSLSEMLRSEGLPPPDAAAGIGVDVASALAFAHTNGVVHRDVKPGNIMITRSGHVKVADFGIARAITGGVEENLTRTGSVMGTATYFSPEQAQGKPVDPRSDLYSLGVVLYEMAVGRPPFSGDSPIAIAYKHVQEQPAPPRSINPRVPPGLEAVILKLLAKDPDQRYATGDDLRRDLRRFMQGQQVQAVVPPPVAPPTQATTVLNGDDYVETQPATGRTGWFIAVLVVLLAVLAGLVYAFANTLGVFEADDSITMPDVTEQPYLVAIATLTELGLEVDFSERETSETVTEGFVIRQEPVQGTEVVEGDTVRIVISSGPPPPATSNLPDVTGRSESDARQTLSDAGFTVVVRSDEFSDTVGVGDVIRMDPPGGPGAQYPPTQPITLYVSTGPDPSRTTTTTLPPTTEAPTTEAPTTEPPVTDPPVTDPPATDPPDTSGQ